MKKEVTYNLNGKKIEVEGAGVETTVVSTFTVGEETKLTFVGDGIVDGGEGNKGNKTIAINGGEVVIKGGTFQVGYDKDRDTNSVVYLQKNGSKLTIEDGVFKSIYNDRYVGKPWSYVVNVSNSLTDFEIEIKGGEFYDWDPAEGDDKLGNIHNFGEEDRSWIAEGYESYLKREEEDTEGRGKEGTGICKVYGVRRKA